jgi:hypothetical protein
MYQHELGRQDEIKPHVLRASLKDGEENPEIFIPKIPLICNNTDFPAKFTRI